MNAAAYLTKQGWRGQGHSLDLTNRGLSKPLLLAHKFDNDGLGKKKADTDFSNQWWLNAWSSPATPAQSGDSTPAVPATGLYSHFTRGQILESTFDMAKKAAAEAAEPDRPASKKRKHQDEVTAPEQMNGVVEVSDAKPRKKSKKSTDSKKEPKSKKSVDKAESNDQAEQEGEHSTKKSKTKIVLDEEPPPKRPDGPAHPESIAALKDAGERVMLPLLPFLPKDSRDIFYRAYEAARKESSAQGGTRLVLGNVREYMSSNPAFRSGGAETTKSYKGDKIERERLKREAKREHAHWLTVFQQPWLYRPDGTPVDGSEVDVEHTKKKKKAKTEKKKKEPVDYAKLHEEKKARRAAKDERRAEMRAIKKKARAEKKVRNQEKQVELRRLAQERKKEAQRLEDVAEAAKQGLSYEDFVNRRLEETLQKELSKNAAKKAKAEARAAIAKTRQEQMLRDTAELNGTVPPPATNGSTSAKAKAPVKKPSGSARKGSDFISLDAGASSDEESDSDDSSDSDDDSSDITSDDGVAVPAAAKSSSVSEAAQEEGLGFIVDTVGNNANKKDATASFPSRAAEPKKKVKDMTKEERKARLEVMRARREERRARQGKDPQTKKARKQSRAERKERMINKLTSEILVKKRRLLPDPSAPEVQAMSKKEQKAQPAEAKGWTREDWKSAKREARRFQRAVKAGKVPEHEVPLGWTGTVRKEPKRKGAGGKDPQRPFWHEWTMGGERIDLREG